MTKTEQIISALSNRGGFDGWWGDIDEDIQQEIIAEIDAIIDESASAELAYLRWFYGNADFGPAEDDVRAMMQSEYEETGASLPDGYS